MNISREWIIYTVLCVFVVIYPNRGHAKESRESGSSNDRVYSFVLSGNYVPDVAADLWIMEANGTSNFETYSEPILMSSANETGYLQLSAQHSALLASLLANHKDLRLTSEGVVATIQAEQLSPTDFKLKLTYLCTRTGKEGCYKHVAIDPEADTRGVDPDSQAHVAVDPDAHAKLPRSFYTQYGFPRPKFERDFFKWKKQLKVDLDSFLKECPKSAFGFPLPNEAAEAKAFGNSIDFGKKGSSLRKALIASIFVDAPRILPPERMMLRMLLSKEARPVGFGGTFLDNGRTVELWYVVFHDMKELTKGDLKKISAFSVFEPPELPRFNETRRDSWPALAFVRGEKGELKLFAMSRELALILERMQWKALT